LYCISFQQLPFQFQRLIKKMKQQKAQVLLNVFCHLEISVQTQVV
jgi:hypothetical protein